MSSVHISAEKDEIAEIVLMPGDPLRAKYIADNYLEDAVLFNSVRNMFGYTGTYKGKRISVMGSGMGMPSIGIYSYELYTFFDVDTIIRIGSAGAYTSDLKLHDTILGSHAWSESSYAKIQSGYNAHTIDSDKELNEKIILAAEKNNIELKVGGIHSSDVFYRELSFENYADVIVHEHGCKMVEMESFALFANAKVLNKKAACILTISDSFVTKEELSAEDREQGLKDMITLALESCL